jgi:hypothetical protein
MPELMNRPIELPVGQPKRLLKTRPRTREYEVDRDDGPVTLTGYYAGDTCPIWVTIEVQTAVDAYTEAGAAIDRTSTRLSDWTGPALRQRQSILCAVIRGLTEEEAAVMAADGGDWQDVLVELGWWTASAEDKADDDPEVMEAVGSTSDDSSRASPSTTRGSIS